MVIGDVQYPARIFSLWTASELAAIGIYEITFDDSNKKDQKYYINTNQTYTYDADAGTVIAAYGNATAKAHADTLFTAQDETDGKGTEGEVATRGLKYNLIQTLKQQVATSPSVPLPSVSSCAVHKMSACAFAVAVPYDPVTLPLPNA